MDNNILDNYMNITLNRDKSFFIFRNARIVNVISDEVKKCDIAVCNGTIVAISDYLENIKADDEIDLKGKFVCPGFINTYTVLESSLMSLQDYDMLSLKNGTTTFVADLTNVYNIAGYSGVANYLKESENLNCNPYFLLPVSALKNENISQILSCDSILGLTVSPDDLSDSQNYKHIFESLNHTKIKNILPVMPLYSENNIKNLSLFSTCAIVGASSVEEASQVLRAGKSLSIRDGSYVNNVRNIIVGAIRNFLPMNVFSFNTYLKNAKDLINDGFINASVKKAVNAGLNPVYSIKMATINASSVYSLNHLGSISVGKQADMVVLNDLTSVDIDSVYVKGKCVNKSSSAPYYPPNFFNTISTKKLKPDILSVDPIDNITVIKILNDSMTTFCSDKKSSENFDSLNKIFVSDKNFDNTSIAYIENIGIKNAAVASSISLQNDIISIGDNDDDMFLALNRLQQSGGGIVIVSNNTVVSEIHLPVLAAVSKLPVKKLLEQITEFESNLQNINFNSKLNLFSVLNNITSTNIPKVKITPNGIFHVLSKSFVNLKPQNK